MADDPHALKPGASIAGYSIVRVLGAGGFGITYEADSPFTGKRVAIKEFFPRGIASREGGARLVYAARDAELVAWALKRFESSTLDQCRLKHPNIVDVIHYVQDNGTGYMIMEYVEGQTLEHWLRARATPPAPEELRPLIEPVLAALDYLHGMKMVHRDIAPDNIMVRADGRPVLIDFGAIKLIEQHTRIRSQAEKSFMVAKQFYSPPEQIDADGALDHRADIYATGAVLYRAFTGRPPASAEERMQKRAFGKADPYVAVAALAPQLPDEIADGIDRALAFDAAARQPRIAALRRALGWADGGEATEITLPRALRREATIAPRRSRLPWILPLLGIAGIAAAVAYWNGFVTLPKFGSELADAPTPAPKLDDVKEVPEMQVKTAPDGTMAEDDDEPEVPDKYPKRYAGEVSVYRVVETSPDQPLTNCVIGRRMTFSVEVEGTTLHISHGGNAFVTEINPDGSFHFQSGAGEPGVGGLLSRKTSFAGTITPEAIEGEYVSTVDRGSCFGKLTARPLPGG